MPPIGHQRPAVGMRAITLRAALLLALFAAVVVAPTGRADAHTALSSSDPADGTVVDTPVEVVTLTFTDPVGPVDDGYEALDGSGVVRSPTDVTAENATITLRFVPPLTGAVGVRWEATSPDGHVIAGAFSFTAGAAPIETVPPPTTAPTTAPADTASPPTTAQAGPATTTPTATTIAPAVTTPGHVMPDGTVHHGPMDDQGNPQLADFLAHGTAHDDDLVATISRVVQFAGVALAVGGLILLATTFRGRQGDLRLVLRMVRAAGLVVVVGAIVELVRLAVQVDTTFLDALTTSHGVACALRIAGGFAVTNGLRDAWTPSAATERAVSAAVAEPAADETSQARWALDAGSTVGVAGALAIVISFWFDGHTVSEGIRPLHTAANTVHVVAGSVWLGGVTVLTVLWWIRRHRAGDSGDDHTASTVAPLVARFSTIAGATLAAAALAGLVMTVSILDDWRDLTGTDWGRLLIIKTAAVAVAAAIGAYNHVRLVPALDASPGDAGVVARVRTTMTVEVVVLVVVVAATAYLVTASPV